MGIEIVKLWNRYEENDLRIRFTGGWTFWDSVAASGGHYAWGDMHDCVVSFKFKGTQFAYVAYVESRSGVARIRLDSTSTILAEVDLYSLASKYNQLVYTSPVLADGYHVVTIEWTGKNNAAADNEICAISLDAVEISGVLVAP